MTQRELADLGIDGNWTDFMARAGEFASWCAVYDLLRWYERTRASQRSKSRLYAGVDRAMDCYRQTFGMDWAPF